MFARIENNAVVEWPIASIYPLFPNTSFPSPLTPADMPEGYVMVGVMPPPPYGRDEKIVPSQPVQQGEQWLQSWAVLPMTAEELRQRYDNAAAQARQERDTKLAACDWTQGKDIPDAISTPWAAYRQDLRDISNQAGFPYDVQWPQTP